MQTVTPVTVLVPHFARETKTRNDRRPYALDTATRLARHFTHAAACRPADDVRRTRVPCSGGYRIIRKRLAD